MHTDDRYRHIFASNAAFDARVARVIETRNAARSRMMLALPRFCLGGALRLVAAAWLVKAATVVVIGPTSYDARIADIRSGVVPAYAVTAILGRDPLMRAATGAGSRATGAIRRIKAGL